MVVRASGLTAGFLGGTHVRGSVKVPAKGPPGPVAGTLGGTRL